MKKRSIVFIVTIMLIVAVAVSVTAAQKTVYGDVTGDSNVDVSDVIKLLQLLANDGIYEFNQAQKTAFDVNCDAKVDVSDAIRTLQHLASPDTIILGPEKSPKITITVENVSDKAGETVMVPIYISNNTGVAGATITVTYSPKLTLTAAASGTAFEALDFTHTEGLHNPTNLMWDSQSDEATADGVIANLSFVIPNNAKTGDKYEVKCSYRYGDIYNNNWDDLTPVVVDGIITVK